MFLVSTKIPDCSGGTATNVVIKYIGWEAAGSCGFIASERAPDTRCEKASLATLP